MSLRSTLARVARRYNDGQEAPPIIADAMNRQGMNFTVPFGPGTPLAPFDGFSRPPRALDYAPGANLYARPRTETGRISFETLGALVDNYDVAQMCLNHRIDGIRSLEWRLAPGPGVDYDVSGAFKAAEAALAYPDRELPYGAWVAKYLWNVLRTDSGALYRRRNRAGEVIGLEVVDGETIAPLIDEYGRRPKPPAPAFQLWHQGQPWVDLTTDDLIYVPFWPRADSVYGSPPAEKLILSINTDMRHQWMFLQYFTEGSMPAGFAEAPPDRSHPDQVAEWQAWWDAVMEGDQAQKHKIRWVPAGTHWTAAKQVTFDASFPTFLLRKTCAMFGVVPSDLGFVDDVNRANGETQVDTQFRVNDLPLIRHLEQIVTAYLRDDLGLPVVWRLDTGQAKEDRVKEAQAWQIYINTGMASADEGREKVLGLPTDPSRPVPRIIMDPRIGPVPLSSVEAVSGKINPHTLSPSADAPLPQVTPDTAAPAIVANKASGEPAAPSNPEPPQFIPAPKHPADGTPSVANPEAVAKATEGVTAATGIEGEDLIGDDDEDEQKRDELATFGRFVKTRARKGVWRDFDFRLTDRVTAHRLNDEGRTQILKAAGQTVAAGLAVQADDTGRVLLIQRALDEDDPAGGMFEFPGGHVETGETPKQAAYREWQEETGILLPYVPESPDLSWSNGVYEGFVWRVPTELPLADRDTVSNPDDPDGDALEAICWVAPQDLSSMPLRPELAAELDDVLAVLATDVAKAASGDPKARPASRFEQQLVAHWTRMLQSAIRTLTPVATLAAQLVAMFAGTAETIIESAVAASIRIDRDVLSGTLKALYADGYVAGAKDVAGQAPAGSLADELARIDWAAWAPGKTAPMKLATDPGFETLADQIAQRVTGIDETTRNLIAQTVRDGVAGHKSTGRIADDIEAVLADPKRARLIAVTEINRAMSAGAMAMYRANGIETWDLITAPDPCPICQAIKDANPHPMSDTADQSPVHPACRCAIAAHVEV